VDNRVEGFELRRESTPLSGTNEGALDRVQHLL
jgi:hypothetical protein